LTLPTLFSPLALYPLSLSSLSPFIQSKVRFGSKNATEKCNDIPEFDITPVQVNLSIFEPSFQILPYVLRKKEE
jgi:hypothetical protein